MVTGDGMARNRDTRQVSAGGGAGERFARSARQIFKAGPILLGESMRKPAGRHDEFEESGTGGKEIPFVLDRVVV
jgi:hypothetical protein